MTEWKEIVAWPGYWISDTGQVSSNKLKELKWSYNDKGYPYVTLSKNSRPKKRPIHQLVLEAFVGPRPDGMVACHNDGDVLNASVDNLRWDTQKNNLRDRDIHGTGYKGAGHPKARLTNTLVVEIRGRHNAGEGVAKLSRAYGVSEGCVRGVVKGRTWKHLL